MRQRVLRRLTMYLLLAAVGAVLAGGSSAAFASDHRNARFEKISRDQGLSQSFVYGIAQDRDGFLWIGTQEGLNRYDGFGFRVFFHDRADPTSISDETIRTMCITRDGVLWIGTDAGGLSRYDPDTESFTSYRHDPADDQTLSDDRVRVVYEDSEGQLWVGTDGAGLDRFDRAAGTFRNYAHDADDDTSLAGASVWSVLEDRAGRLWVATDNGLSLLDRSTGRTRNFRHDPADPASLADNRTRVLFEDSAGNLWIGTESGGLNRLDRDTGSFERFVHDPDDPASISANRINAIYEDSAETLWVGTVRGLNAWEAGTQTFERFVSDPGDPYSLANNQVMSLFEDRGGVFWVGTYDGLSKLSPDTRSMLHYRKRDGAPDSLASDTVTAFAETGDGSVWVGTYGGGISRLDRGADRFVHLQHDPSNPASISSNQVMALAVDSGGSLWAGTRAAGLNRIDPATLAATRYRSRDGEPGSLSADGVSAILEAHDGRLWIGTFGGGLNRYEPASDAFTVFRHDPAGPDAARTNRILALYEDGDGFIWAGTYGGGLLRFEPASGESVRYRHEPGNAGSLSGDEITLIREDARGDLWIAAKGEGLNRWRRRDRDSGRVAFEHLTERDGMPSRTIYAAALDGAGNLWMSSTYGVTRFDPERLAFRNYHASDGLQDEEFTLGAGFAAADGTLYFGGINGFNAFDPAELNGAGPPPLVAITSFTSMNAPVLAGGAQAAQLDHRDRVLSFEFAALDFAAPDKSRYEYMLEGLDSGWTDGGTRRHVTYTNLPPGEYTFRVRAVNRDGAHSTADAQLAFGMLPPPWRSNTAYAAYVATVALLLMLAFRAHTRRIEAAARLEHAERLARVQARLAEAQRIAGIGNWEWRRETGDVWWSDEIYRLLQVSRGALGSDLGAFLDRVPAADRESLRPTIDRALEKGQPFACEHRVTLPDGTGRIVHQRGEVELDQEGRTVRLACTVHDITDRKQAESEIRHHADFQSMLAELSSDLLRARPDDIGEQVRAGLARIGHRYGLHSIAVRLLRERENGEPGKAASLAHDWRADGSARRSLPDLAPALRASGDDEPFVIQDVGNLATVPVTTLRSFEQAGVRSMLIIPLRFDETAEVSVSYARSRDCGRWTHEEIAELKLAAEVLATAMVRSSAVARIRELKDELEAENYQLRDEIRVANGFSNIVGEDPGLRRCLQAVEKVAPTDVPVLLLGETGTGKELFARAVHGLSHRRDQPLVVVTCPALPASLIESELFGHEQGAFTGAHSKRRGRFELAEGGTLFLDEIGELPLDLQSKLLRVLQTGDYQRLGGGKTLHADVRVIAATNRDLDAEVRDGRFRADLFYRINSYPIQLPALRHRKDDIPLLAEFFVQKHADKLGKTVDAISARTMRKLIDYNWPGNVRELESVIERAMISMEKHGVLDLPPSIDISPARIVAPGTTASHGSDLTSVERNHIIDVLQQTDWKIAGPGGAASLLGMPSSTLRSRMKRLGISRKDV